MVFDNMRNPFINSSSSLTLDNRFTLMDGQNAETRGQVLFYPNPFRIRGAILQYYLNKPETVESNIMTTVKCYSELYVRQVVMEDINNVNKLNLMRLYFVILTRQRKVLFSVYY